MISRSSTGVVGESLRECTDVNLISAQGLAYRADKDPSATDLGELALIKITGRRNAHEGRVAAAGGQRDGYLARLRAGEHDIRAPSRMGRIGEAADIRSSEALGPDLW